MKMIIGPGRLSFPRVFKPNDEQYGGKYSTTLLLPPDFDFAPLKAAMVKVASEKWGPDKAKWPKNLRGPAQVIRDCAEKAHLTGYEPGWHFITASSGDQPGVVNGALEDVTDEREVYAGRWALLSINVYAYDNVTKGVGLGLQNIQVRKHDDAFSGRARAKDEFEEYYDDMAGERAGGAAAGGGSGDDFDGDF